ncbi:peptidoglycan editing factor PgeF [Parvularcula sp. ZS-1/3]|uniref:Purine nucleoside phosphorylase n=1 Tax=Parvularcula mediterranea TaxID=2732508 RepID=A0A7Y3W5C4_9PROT|nr:peptidoglycan editing factor PgeF [Parvularcula mediterranea]NNU16373.1 peptidoglycan editing factor PgeF [Parvularcula mediterranea]
MIPRLTSNLLNAPHGFFGREGGVSEGIFASLNGSLHSGDELEPVTENRQRMTEALGAEHVLTAKQTHSARAILVGEPFPPDQRPEADALVTGKAGLAVGVLAADCVPVLFDGGDLVAAAHAGWRGSLGGILEATVALMEAEGVARENLRAAIGPHLRGSHFEVREDLLSEVTAKYPDADQFFTKKDAEHWHYDHTGFVRARLIEAGISDDLIADTGGNTLAEPQRFFSYRAACHAGEKQFGHNLSAIVPGVARPA